MKRKPDGFWRMVVRYWKDNPGCTVRETADILGTSTAYVRALSQRRGMTFARHKRRKADELGLSR